MTNTDSISIYTGKTHFKLSFVVMEKILNYCYFNIISRSFILSWVEHEKDLSTAFYFFYFQTAVRKSRGGCQRKSNEAWKPDDKAPTDSDLHLSGADCPTVHHSMLLYATTRNSKIFSFLVSFNFKPVPQQRWRQELKQVSISHEYFMLVPTPGKRIFQLNSYYKTILWTVQKVIYQNNFEQFQGGF